MSRLEDELTLQEYLKAMKQLVSEQNQMNINFALNLFNTPDNHMFDSALERLDQNFRQLMNQSDHVAYWIVGCIIQSDNLDRIQDLLDKCCNIDLHRLIEPNGYLINCKSVEMLHLLLQNGLDLNKCIDSSFCPLMYVDMPVFVNLVEQYGQSLADWYIRTIMNNKDNKSVIDLYKIQYYNRQVGQLRSTMIPLVDYLPAELTLLVCDCLLPPIEPFKTRLLSAIDWIEKLAQLNVQDNVDLQPLVHLAQTKPQRLFELLNRI